MFMRQMLLMTFVLTIAFAAPASAQERPDAAKAFEHYEAVRKSLSADTLEGVGAQARALVPLAAQLGGDSAREAAGALARATELEAARELFATLSEALVPVFLDADLPGVTGFVCSMKKAQWVQRGEEVQNPYYGKTMATCGVPIKDDGRIRH